MLPIFDSAMEVVFDIRKVVGGIMWFPFGWYILNLQSSVYCGALLFFRDMFRNIIQQLT